MLRFSMKNSPLRAASKKNLTKRDIKWTCLTPIYRRSCPTYTSDLNFSSSASQATALVSPFRQKVTDKKRWFGTTFSTKGGNRVNLILELPFLQKVAKSNLEVPM